MAEDRVMGSMWFGEEDEVVAARYSDLRCSCNWNAESSYGIVVNNSSR